MKTILFTAIVVLSANISSAQWQPFVFTNTIVEDLYIIEDTLYADVDGDIYFTGDNGVTWDSITSQNAISNYREIGDKRYYYKYTTVGSTNGIYRRDMSQSATGYHLWKAGWGSNFEITTDNRLVAQRGESIFISFDNGVTVDTPYTFPNGSDADLNAIGPRNEFFVSMKDAPSDNGLLLSTDFGNTFTNVLPVNDDFYLADFGHQGVNYYGIFQSYLLKSVDTGHTWTYSDIASQIHNGFLAQILVDGGNIFVGKQYTDVAPHVYVSTNNGSNFSDFGQGLSGFIDCRQMLIHGGYIYLATGQGLFRRAYNGTVGIEEVTGNATLDIVPNPAQNQLTISTSLSGQTATYTLLDVTGRMALTGELADPQTTVDVTVLSKGMYILKVKGGAIELSRKIFIE